MTDDNKTPAVSFSSSVVSLTNLFTPWRTGRNNDSGVSKSFLSLSLCTGSRAGIFIIFYVTFQVGTSQTEPDFVSNDDQLCLPVQVSQLTCILYI